MKKLALMVLIITMPIFAAGNGLLCRDNRVIADGGYTISVSQDDKRAAVYENTIVGPRKLADLECRRLPAREPNGADIPQAWLSCKKPGLADAGYAVVVSAGGFAGLTTATLEEINFAGTDLLADLTCKEQE